MAKLLNTRMVTELPLPRDAAARSLPRAAPIASAAIVTPPLGPDASIVPPRDLVTNTSPPGWLLLLGHVVASLIGLSLGYFVLCWLRPGEFNGWDLLFTR